MFTCTTLGTCQCRSVAGVLLKINENEKKAPSNPQGAGGSSVITSALACRSDLLTKIKYGEPLFFSWRVNSECFIFSKGDAFPARQPFCIISFYGHILRAERCINIFVMCCIFRSVSMKTRETCLICNAINLISAITPKITKAFKNLFFTLQ